MGELSRDDEALIFAAELGDAPHVDLHGLSEHEAIRELDAALDRAFMRRERVLKIIHGRGTEKLKLAVGKFLKTHSLVSASRESEHPAQSGAVTYAVLAKR